MRQCVQLHALESHCLPWALLRRVAENYVTAAQASGMPACVTVVALNASADGTMQVVDVERWATTGNITQEPVARGDGVAFDGVLAAGLYIPVLSLPSVEQHLCYGPTAPDSDPYAWAEDPSSPATGKWLLGGLPARASVGILAWVQMHTLSQQLLPSLPRPCRGCRQCDSATLHGLPGRGWGRGALLPWHLLGQAAVVGMAERRSLLPLSLPRRPCVTSCATWVHQAATCCWRLTRQGVKQPGQPLPLKLAGSHALMGAGSP